MPLHHFTIITYKMRAFQEPFRLSMTIYKTRLAAGRVLDDWLHLMSADDAFISMQTSRAEMEIIVISRSWLAAR